MAWRARATRDGQTFGGIGIGSGIVIGHILIDVRSNICHQIRCTERTRQASIAGKENDHVYLIRTGATVLLGISPVSLDTGPYCCKRIGFRVDAAQQ